MRLPGLLASVLLLISAGAAAQPEEPFRPKGSYNNSLHRFHPDLDARLNAVRYGRWRALQIAWRSGINQKLDREFSGYLREKKLNILVQFALERDAHMADVPTVLELTKNAPKSAEATQVFRHLVSNDETGRSLFTTPNVFDVFPTVTSGACVQDSVTHYNPANDPDLTTLGSGFNRGITGSLSGGT